MDHTLGIDIGGTKFAMAVFHPDGRIVERHTEATNREGGRDWMLERISNVAQQWMPRYRFARCGIGFGGPVHFNQQRIAMSTHVGGWSDFDLPGFLDPVLGLRPVMDNDANVGALGESMDGAGRGLRPLIYMTLSTGIGSGIVLDDGGVYRGADSFAGELGHLTIDPDGPPCLCGSNGCFERMCCGLWMERDYGRTAQELLTESDFVSRYVVLLARGLKAAIMILNPARIVIGGGISKAGDALFIPLRAELRRQIPQGWSHARIDVVPAALGDDSVLRGAFHLAQSQ